jgi:hypothetical protein
MNPFIIEGSKVASVMRMMQSRGIMKQHAVHQVNMNLKARGFIVKCQRCSKETKITTGSYFDTSVICMGCDKLEREHPSYAHAILIENEHVKQGDTNFAGIGLPTDWDDYVRRVKA